nr:phage tail protein [uncultured Holophaga sp.]
MSWGSLGDLVFETIAGPLDEAYKWAMDVAEHPVAGRKARLQVVGPKLQELTLRIRLHTSINSSPELDLRVLKDSMEAGEVLDLVIGELPDQGLWAGQWLLTSLDLAAIERWPGGLIRNTEVTLTLKEWVAPSDLTVSQRKAVKPKGGTISPAVTASGAK